MSEKPDRHTRFISELRELLERNNALLDTPGPEGMSAVHVVYTDVPMTEMDLYPVFTETGEFSDALVAGLPAKYPTSVATGLADLVRGKAALLASLDDCVELLTDMALTRDKFDAQFYESLDERIKSAQRLLDEGGER